MGPSKKGGRDLTKYQLSDDKGTNTVASCLVLDPALPGRLGHNMCR